MWFHVGVLCFIILFFNDTATTEIYTYGHTRSLHDALPICPGVRKSSTSPAALRLSACAGRRQYVDKRGGALAGSGRTGKGLHGGAAFYASRVTKARPSGYGTGKLVRRGNLNGPGKQKACSRRFLFLHRRKVRPPALLPHAGEGRSEEHTSELQSLMRTSYDVFCLKKKKKTTNMLSLAQTNTIKYN